MSGTDTRGTMDEEVKQSERAQRPRQGLIGSSAVAVVDGQRHGEEDRRGWGSLDEGLLPLIASKVEENKRTKSWQRNLAVLRLVCRQWAAESLEGCAWLTVAGKGPMGWEHRFCGLEMLVWGCPETILDNPGQCWPKLRSLRLRNCGDGDLQMLRDLPGLTYLNLGFCDNITDAGLKEIGNISALSLLNLSGCEKITDAGLKELVRMTSLTGLDLSECGNITDAGLKELGRMTSLTSLDLYCCIDITDAGLKELGRMTALQSLEMSFCRETTEAGRRELAEQLPNLSCGISYMSDTPIAESDEDYGYFDSDDGDTYSSDVGSYDSGCCPYGCCW